MSALASSPLPFSPTAMQSRAGGQPIRCFTVRVDARFYGLPVQNIQTVFEITAITPVPLAPNEVLGIVNLRGKIATAFSLRRRLGNNPKALEPSTLAVGLDHNGESFAVVVDEVGDVLTLDPETEIEVPSHLGAESVRFSSVHRLEHEILPVLDLDWALTIDSNPSQRLNERESASGAKL